MSNAKFTLIGCNSYFNTIGQGLFDNLTLPAELTKQTLTDNILLTGGEFEVQYADPDFLREAIGLWSRKWMPTMERWVKALAIEYNPLENYDRIEDWTDDTAGSGATSSETSSSKHTVNDMNGEKSEAGNISHVIGSTLTDTTDRDKYNDPPTHEVTKSAYDSSSYQPQLKETDKGKWEEKHETVSNDDVSNSVAGSEHNNQILDDTLSGRDMSSNVMNNNSKHSGRIHGNIGVTTSQQMLQAELDLGYWNIYEKITELFLQEFTIPVYA